MYYICMANSYVSHKYVRLLESQLILISFPPSLAFWYISNHLSVSSILIIGIFNSFLLVKSHLLCIVHEYKLFLWLVLSVHFLVENIKCYYFLKYFHHYFTIMFYNTYLQTFPKKNLLYSLLNVWLNPFWSAFSLTSLLLYNIIGP